MTPWIDVYKTALLETNWSIIEERIQAADSAINARLHELSLNHVGSPNKIKRIEDALHGLSVRREVAEWHRSQAGKRA